MSAFSIWKVCNAYLINHHHSEKITYRGKEKPIEIVLHVVADGIAEDVQNDLSDYKEEDAKGNVSQRPSILQSVGDKDHLHDHIDEQADAIDKIEYHKQP